MKGYKINIRAITIEQAMELYEHGYALEVHDGKKAKVFKENYFKTILILN